MCGYALAAQTVLCGFWEGHRATVVCSGIIGCLLLVSSSSSSGSVRLTCRGYDLYVRMPLPILVATDISMLKLCGVEPVH